MISLSGIEDRVNYSILKPILKMTLKKQEDTKRKMG